MKPEKDWTENQMNIFASYYHGMIFVLSVLLISEIPGIIFEGNLFVRLSMILIVIPFLLFFNYIMFRNLKAIWIKENKLRDIKTKRGKK